MGREPNISHKNRNGNRKRGKGSEDNWMCQVFQTPQGRWSSKRFFGGLGFTVVLGVLVYCTLTHTEAPAITEIVCIVSASLMGIGVVEPYFRQRTRIIRQKEDDDSSEEDQEP